MPGHVLGAVAKAYDEPRTRVASAPGRQPPVRGRGRGGSPGADRGHRPPNPAAQGPSWTPRTTSSPSQIPAPPWSQPGGERWPNPRPLAPLIAQLVTRSSCAQPRDAIVGAANKPGSAQQEVARTTGKKELPQTMTLAGVLPLAAWVPTGRFQCPHVCTKGLSQKKNRVRGLPAPPRWPPGPGFLSS
jgi:hypothetical protein